MLFSTERSIPDVNSWRTHLEKSRLICLFPRTGITKYHKLGDLIQQEFILSLFCRMKDWDRGVSRIGLLPVSLRENLAHVPLLASDGGQHPWCSLVCRCTTPIFACLCRNFSPVSVSMSKFPSSYGTSHIGFRAHPNLTWPHLHLIISTKTLFAVKVTFTGSVWTWILGNSTEDIQETESGMDEDGEVLTCLINLRSFSMVGLKCSGDPKKWWSLRGNRSLMIKSLCAKLRNLNFLRKSVGVIEGF